MKQGNRRAWLLAGALVGALVLVFAGLAGAKIKTKTFSSGDIDRVIPDLDDASHDFALTQKKFKRSKVKDVDLAVRISHDWLSDVSLSLTGPTGRTVDLSSRNGGPGTGDYGEGSEDCNGTLTVFNDEAETPVADSADPWAGQFQPEERLSTLDGTRVKGVWRLTASDEVGSQSGVLHCAELKVKYRKKKKKN